MIFLLGSALLVVQICLAVLVSYLLLLTVAALRANNRTILLQEDATLRFLILVPAHNEERLLPALLESLRHLDYHPSQFAIHVVADNCSDRTAIVAKCGGAIVHERTNMKLVGKGYALQWLLGRIREAGEQFDAVVILDADSIVSPNFLQVMNKRLISGERVIQAHYTVLNPDYSWTSSLRYAALAVLHYLRPQGRMVLGGSVGLKGNGMVFADQVIQKHKWSESVTEDIEYHMVLLLDGERVTFAPDATVWGEMPNTLDKSQSQHTRWEQGRLDMARKYVPRLFDEAMSELRNRNYQRAYQLIDAAMEHIIPPLSILFGLSFTSLILGLFLFGVSFITLGRFSTGLTLDLASLNIILSFLLLLGQVMYLFIGLVLVHAPRKIYLSLFYAPVLIIWKIGHYIQVIFRRNQSGWVRTSRNEV